MRGLQATVLVLFTLIVGTDMGKPLSGQAPARDGFFIGFGVGGGSVAFEDESDREGSGVGHFKIGGALSDHVLLGAEVGGWSQEMGEGVTITSSYLNAVAYLYPAPTGGLFLKGGIGFASLIGFTLGAGYDIGFGGRFGLTPYADFHQGFFEDGSTRLVSLGLSFNWY